VGVAALLGYQNLAKARKGELLNEIKSEMAQLNTIHHEFVVIGILTLIFGFLVPYIVIRLSTTMLNTVRLEMQKTAYDVMKTWSEERTKYGEQAFQNVDFWLQILLTMGHHSGRLSSHPMAQMLGELAFLMQKELTRLESERSKKAA
jgi:hypothetical protein